VCVAEDAVAPLEWLCRRARDACAQHAAGAVRVDVVMVDFAGQGVVARA
jgi:hypothetical protein